MDALDQSFPSLNEALHLDRDNPEPRAVRNNLRLNLPRKRGLARTRTAINGHNHWK